MAHVLFIPPDSAYSGPARQASLLAPALARRGWTAEVFSWPGVGRSLPRTAGALRASARLADLVHVFGLGPFRRRVVATIGMARPRLVVSLTGHERLTWLDRRLLRSAHRILVPHGTAADKLLAQRVPNGRVEILPPGVATPARPPDRATLLEALGLPADTRLAITTARLDAFRRLSDAVWSFEFLRFAESTPRLLIVGAGPARAALERFSRELAPEWQNVGFTGPRPDAPDLVAAADVAFVPHRTGGANAALEAMAAGVPVVAANTPDLAAVVRDGVTGVLVPVGSPPTAAKEVQRFLFDPARGLQFGTAGRQTARADHSVEGVAGRLESLYRG